MARTVAIGIQSFDEIIKKNYFYIDKTNLTQERSQAVRSRSGSTMGSCWG